MPNSCRVPQEVPQSADLESRGAVSLRKELAPQVGLEPTTLRLTAECSAIELLRSVFGGRTILCPPWLYQTADRRVKIPRQYSTIATRYVVTLPCLGPPEHAATEALR